MKTHRQNFVDGRWYTMPAITGRCGTRAGVPIDWVVEKPFASLQPAMHPAVHRVISHRPAKWRKSLYGGRPIHARPSGGVRSGLSAMTLVLDMQGSRKVRWGQMANAGREPATTVAVRGNRWQRCSISAPHASRKRCMPSRARASSAAFFCRSRHRRYATTVCTSAPAGERQSKAGCYAVLITGASRPEKALAGGFGGSPSPPNYATRYGLVWLWAA